MRNIRAFIRKQKEILIVFLVLCLFAGLMMSGRHTYNPEQDLFNTETLPESELDALLAERGIEEAVIECIPVWEKQYLIACDVDAVIFGEGVNTEWERDNVYKKLADEEFSMQVIVARIWREENGKHYPAYHIIIPYAWEKLPVWTGEDDLIVLWDGEKYLIEGSMETCQKVDYVRRGGEVVRAITDRSAFGAGFYGIHWTIDIKRSLGGSVKDGYMTVTLCKKNASENSVEEPFEVQVCYTHNIAALKRGSCIDGAQLKLRQSMRARHFLLKNRYDFTGL